MGILFSRRYVGKNKRRVAQPMEYLHDLYKPCCETVRHKLIEVKFTGNSKSDSYATMYEEDFLESYTLKED